MSAQSQARLFLKSSAFIISTGLCGSTSSLLQRVGERRPYRLQDLGGVGWAERGREVGLQREPRPPFPARLPSILSVHFQHFYIASLQSPSLGSSRRSTLSASIFWSKLTCCFLEVLVSLVHSVRPVKKSEVQIRAR